MMAGLQTFPKQCRIKSKFDFEKCYHKGHRIYGLFYSVYILPSIQTRIGISIPKRLGNAVFRNREKRIIRELFRKYRLGFQGNWDCVFVMNRSTGNEAAKNDELRRLFEWLKSFNHSSVES